MCSSLFHTCIMSHMSGHLNASGYTTKSKSTAHSGGMANGLRVGESPSVCVFILDYQSESVLLKLAESFELLWTLPRIIKSGLRNYFMAFIMSIDFTIKAYLSYNAKLQVKEKGKVNGMCKIALLWLTYIILRLDSAQ